jgi:hypothetical protein
LSRTLPTLRQLTPFILLSLVLHGAAFWLFHTQLHAPRDFTHLPLQVSLSFNKYQAIDAQKSNASRVKKSNTKRLLTRQTTQWIPSVIPEASGVDAQDWVASARLMVHEDAVLAERDLTANDKRQLDTPFGRMQAMLKKPHTETRLEGGMVKWEGAAGAVCFNEPPPYFAWDAPNLFKMARSCP